MARFESIAFSVGPRTRRRTGRKLSPA